MREQHPCRVGAIVRVAKHRCLYKVERADAVDGGCYRLHLMPMEPPYIEWEEDVARDKGGTWRTEQLEVVELADVAGKAASTARAGAECRSCHAPIYWDRGKDGKPHPYNPDGLSHFITCPDAEEWRSTSRAVAPARESDEPEGQLALFEV